MGISRQVKKTGTVNGVGVTFFYLQETGLITIKKMMKFYYVVR